MTSGRMAEKSRDGLGLRPLDSFQLRTDSGGQIDLEQIFTLSVHQMHRTANAGIETVNGSQQFQGLLAGAACQMRQR